MINPTEIKVDVWHGPIGGYGFRTGMWPCEYQGEKFKVFDSVPHACELKEQERRVRETAARHLSQR